MSIQVTKLPKDTGPAGWNSILASASPSQRLQDRQTADWVVIGAGFAGLAAAHRLQTSNPSDRVTVVDAVRVGHGPAGRNSGFMIDLPHDLSSDNYSGGVAADMAQIRANRSAINYAIDIGREYDLPAEAILKSGKINLAASDRGMSHNRSYASHLQSMSEPYELYDAQTMRDITGSVYYSGGLFTPGTAMIQPAMFVRGVAQGLKSNRVAIYEESPVTAIERQGRNWVVKTPEGTVSAPTVVLAVNGHVESFGFYQRRLMHVFTYASMTRALRDDEVSALGGNVVWGGTPADPMGTTIRRISGIGGHRIVVRNRFTYDPSMEIGPERLTSIARDHDTSFTARFPALSSVEMEYRWGGRLCLSRNGVPAVARVEDGMYSACCQNGLGTVKGIFSGVAAADLAMGVESEFARYVTAQNEPIKLPPEPLSNIGVNAYLKFSEWRAGKEL